MKLKWRIGRVVLFGAFLCAGCAYAMSVAHLPAVSEAEEAAAAARAALARLPAEGRLAEIKNDRVRRAAQATYRAVSELAANKEAAKFAALNAKFERAYSDLERETARIEQKNCAANCKALDGEQCQTRCKAAGTKFCGCKLVVFACIVTECLF